MRTFAVLTLLLLAPAVAAQDIAVLPVGPEDRAFLLATGSAGDFLDLAATGEARARSLDEAVAGLAKADVVVIGEHHAHQAGHDAQARILAALAKARPIALGMEFFESEDDAALAEYVAGTIGVEEMLDRTGWYASGGFHHDYYLPLVDAARAAKAPVFGLNVPRAIVRTVSREGFDELTPEQKALVGQIGEPTARHRFVVDLMMGGIGASMGPAFEGMLRGQMAWDSAMASSILRARSGIAKDRLVVAIAGMGHCAHGLGIPARLRAADPSLKVAVLNPAVAETPDEDAQIHPGMESRASATVSRGYGDWAYVLPDEKGVESHPTFGVKLEPAEGGGMKLASVEAGSVAHRAGLLAGDVLVAVDGRALPGAVGAARFALSGVSWGDRVLMTIRRDGAERVMPVLVVAASDGPGRWLTSRPASELLDGFDPSSSRPVILPVAKDMPHARIVLLGRKAQRLDVLGGTRLLQSWILDDHARPVQGLFAEPAENGAVRVEIDRDPAGAVTGTRRFDAAGKLVEKGAED